MIEKQTWKKVKRFRTDNRIEFYSTKFDQSYKIEGIVRHHTVQYISQQNGVAERMNRILLKRALLGFCLVLKRRWWSKIIQLSLRGRWLEVEKTNQDEVVFFRW